jgi:hypothetical protein
VARSFAVCSSVSRNVIAINGNDTKWYHAHAAGLKPRSARARQVTWLREGGLAAMADPARRDEVWR